MKITIIAPGSRGDVQPYVALGKGLKKSGHRVGILASEDFQSLIRQHSLEFYDLGGSMQDVARGMQDILERGNFLKILSSMGAAAKQMGGQIATSGMVACKGSDLLVAGIGGLFVALALSEKLDIPLLQAYYYPVTPTAEFPNAIAPLPPIHMPGGINRLTHVMVQQMMWQNYRTADNQIRRQVLQMPVSSFWGPFASLQKQRLPVLYGYSALVIPRPPDWDDFIHVTGYWFLDPPEDWEPPEDLLKFLRSGPPPVYIGFGSMVNRRAGELTAKVLKALAQSGQRGILSAGWGGLKNEGLPENVFMVDSLPFNWLFPQMAAVVHHGGAGTTSMGLMAGVPSVITPFMGDQPFWGKQVHQLGAGPRPIPLRHLTVENLAAAIEQAVTDQRMIEKAARLGERIRAEKGVDRAVEIIQEI